ncbi:NAD-dependent epimerase/dehydratase family protein [Cohnella lubricantis]|uniref:NAD-dependent epimerase/dehydratase family protein n=1 Tax=Cohnella lubricantis TaxID=2163172 RepID=A0A841TCE7_9BACL|nr:NAD-dependent epimerase/dehydratase family protein [Cohnella lubricantis]MBB6676121.1 NAD-dependent epimerase/dehydratase family protein [Cohnella lubricantis]MBP2118687.1 nucleoside-diphosphate-sugar epimerase [Cohnella lubricantis]
MGKVLVIGGTRFFGRKLVKRLLDMQMEVTILTRGRAADDFGSKVTRLIADRDDPVDFKRALHSQSYDLVYDNICYSAREATSAASLFQGTNTRYILTSTLSVYPFGESGMRERDYDPFVYPVPNPDMPRGDDYAEGKRLAEAVLFQRADFPVAAVRFPIVLGMDDYTKRLHFHVERVLRGVPIGIPNPDARISFISSDEAASFLAWIGQSSLIGPVNACSRGEITPRQILAIIERAAGRQALMRDETEPSNMSPFGVPESWYMDTTKAESAGYVFQALETWLPKLVEDIVEKDFKSDELT